MSFTILILAGGGALLCTVLSTVLIMRLSGHRRTTGKPFPRGGLATTPVTIAGIALVFWQAAFLGPAVPVLIGAALLGLIGWVDDRRALGSAVRRRARAVLVVAGIAALPGPVFQGLLPVAADWVLTWLVWIWFIDAFDLMDGIDGITGVETGSIGFGLFALSLVVLPTPLMTVLGGAGLVLLGVAIGFLMFNWHPADLLPGSVGVDPLGYICGFMLLMLASQGLWIEALILPLYYLTDAGLTMVRRLKARGNRRIHRPCYRRAVERGWSVPRTVCGIAAGNAALIVIVLGAVDDPAIKLSAAVLVSTCVLTALTNRRRPRNGDKAE